MAGVFDIDIFDPDIFDCGDSGPGPVAETDEERKVTGRLSLSSTTGKFLQASGRLSLKSGLIVSVEVAARLSLTTRGNCG